MSKTKRKKPLTCPVCKRKFSHSAKTHPMKRLSKHLWSEHKSYMLKKQKSGKRKKAKTSQLDEELMLADDMTMLVLLEMDERLARLEGRPTQHQDVYGMAIDHVKNTYAHSKAGEVPTQPLKQALLGAAYRGTWKKRGKKK